MADNFNKPGSGYGQYAEPPRYAHAAAPYGQPMSYGQGQSYGQPGATTYGQPAPTTQPVAGYGTGGSNQGQSDRYPQVGAGGSYGQQGTYSQPASQPSAPAYGQPAGGYSQPGSGYTQQPPPPSQPQAYGQGPTGYPPAPPPGYPQVGRGAQVPVVRGNCVY
jgi:hypothetical protein